MEEKKYYSEEELLEMIDAGTADWLFFVTHHSPDVDAAFADYCQAEHLDPSVDAALAFLDYREGLCELALAEGLM